MFGLEWSRGKCSDVIDYSIYDDKVVRNVSSIVPLMWGEHCLECGAPECYKTCLKYSDRDDHRCKRFKNGIQKLEKGNGIWGYAVKISFKEWGKLECVMFPHAIKYGTCLKYNKFFDITTNISKRMAFWQIKRLNYWYKEWVTRKIGLQNENHPEIFLVEIINPDTPYKLVIERRALGKILFRKNILVRNGFNRVCIPYSEIGYTQGVRNDLSLYPECDKEVDVYICSLDIVSLNLPLCECIDMPKLKCVVWDLDNTLWEGILSECNDVKLRNDVVEIIKELDKRGILNSIASKNDYDEAYKKLEEFGISEYFLCPQINWELKSGNIKRISQILDIGLDTFAFVDDMQYEREEVRNILPVARTYDALDLKNFLSKEETNVPITEESKKRRCSYVEIAKRNIEQSVFSGDLESFVKTCSIVIDVRKPVVADYTRCNELIQRTNQLNLSGKRVTFEEMISMFESNQFVTHTIRAYDKYGDYGLVGVAVYQINDNDKSMEMIHFVLSCRAARKLIEQSYFEYMIQYFGMQGFNTFVVDCAITEKNNLMRESIADIFGKKNQFLDELHYKVVLECDNYKTKYANLMEVKYSQE